MRINRPRKGSASTSMSSINGIYAGFVRKVEDNQRMGRLIVWVPEFGPDIEGSWVRVRYASPFAGTTPITDAATDSKAEDGSQAAYGWWSIPPHVGNEVLIAFSNNDPARGFWFACMYPQNMNSMVPGIGMNVSTDDEMNKKFEPFSPPTVEYNKKDREVDTKKPTRPVAGALAESVVAQGLPTDPERGVGNSSARREDVSMVQGLLTPGGNSMVLDDNPDNSYIRFRTKGGAQILIHDNSGYIYMISKGGNSWLEISDGGVEVYSSAPISMRSEGDINLMADGDLNLDAAGSVNIRGGAAVHTFSGGNIDLAASAALNAQAGGKASLSAGGDLAMGAGGSVGIQGGGSVVTESGGENVRNASRILDNSGGGGGPTADPAQFKETAAIGGRETVASRAPSHEPYEHPITSSKGYAADGTGKVKRSDGTLAEGVTEPDNSPVQKISGFNVSDKVNQCIYEAARKTGVPYENLMALAAKESGFDPNAGQSHAAKGLFQFIPGTFQTMYSRYGPNGSVVKNPGTQNSVFHPCTNALFAAYYYKENVKELQSAGLSSGVTDVYFCHLLGTSGGKKFLRAKKSQPNALSNGVISGSAFSGNSAYFVKKGTGQVRTVTEAYNFVDKQIGQTTPQWAAYKASKQSVLGG